MNKKDLKTNKKPLKIIFGIVSKLLMSIIMLATLTNIVYAAGGSSFQYPSVLSRYNVYDGGSTHQPPSGDYPLNSKDTTAIGFDFLYGNNKSFFVYKGEVPIKIADEDWAKKYRTFNGESLDCETIPYSKNEMEGSII